MANDTRTRMLDATARLLRQRGYHGTSLNDILAASGAPRGSLYFHFPGGKDQLVIEVTRASVAAVAERLRDTLATETRPGEAISKIFAVTAQMLDENFAMGCPVAPVVLDGTNEVPELVELSRQAFERVDRPFSGGVCKDRHFRQARPHAGAAGGIVDRRADDHRPRHPRQQRVAGRSRRACGAGRGGSRQDRLTSKKAKRAASLPPFVECPGWPDPRVKPEGGLRSPCRPFRPCRRRPAWPGRFPSSELRRSWLRW